MGTALNSQEIMADAEKAKEMGVSYGTYKAGGKPEYTESDYKVYTPEYLRKREDVANKKAIAKIKI